MRLYFGYIASFKSLSAQSLKFSRPPGAFDTNNRFSAFQESLCQKKLIRPVV